MAAAPGVCCYLFVLVCEIEFLVVIVRIRHTFQLGKGLLGQRPHIPVHTRHGCGDLAYRPASVCVVVHVVVKNADGSIKAIEVKNYNLASSNSRSELYRELERQVTDRVNNLPSGSTQEIVLDVRGRGFSKDVIENVVTNIQSRCAPVYKDIPVTVMNY